MITIKSTSNCPESVTVVDENGNDILGNGAIAVSIDMRPNVGRFIILQDIVSLVTLKNLNLKMGE